MGLRQDSKENHDSYSVFSKAVQESRLPRAGVSRLHHSDSQCSRSCGKPYQGLRSWRGQSCLPKHKRPREYEVWQRPHGFHLFKNHLGKHFSWFQLSAPILLMFAYCSLQLHYIFLLTERNLLFHNLDVIVQPLVI